MFSKFQGNNVCGAANYQYNPVANGCGSCKHSKGEDYTVAAPAPRAAPAPAPAPAPAAAAAASDS